MSEEKNVDTPLRDFIDRYCAENPCRFHMPGHKGQVLAGGEPYDITEIDGADVLSDPTGIIAASEENARRLFGSGQICYGTEGSSQMIKAMLYLVSCGKENPVILAARNVHQSFVQGCALNDLAVEWLYPERWDSLCSCLITRETLRRRLTAMRKKPAAVYITSPDYLGNCQDVAGLAAVCREFDIPLLVDNAHGAYLRFLSEESHPIRLGAFLCCDSAHKTLPVLTGGAYLHFSSSAAEQLGKRAKQSLALFGSTSPSYLILRSLDCCNAYLADGYRKKLRQRVEELSALKERLRQRGYCFLPGDPLKLTLEKTDGRYLAARLRRVGIYCEYADEDFLVMMVTPETPAENLRRLEEVLAVISPERKERVLPPLPRMERMLSVRRAIFSPWEWVPTEAAAGRICAAPSVHCPPAVPIVVSGERISSEALEWFRFYGIKRVAVLVDEPK